MTVQPVFLLSAPRSGSTVVQRVLAAHSGVATVSEPWVLLPMLRPLRDELPAAGPLDPAIHEAISDLLLELPNGRADYLAAVREAAMHVYEAVAGPGCTWFVDKSPVYHLVVDEIAEAFPEAPLIFLWRNPLAVVASAVELFDDGHFEAPRYTMALFQSFHDLVDARRRYADRSHSVRFEDLVSGDAAVWQGLLSSIGITFQRQALERFAEVDLRGRKGDPAPVRRRLDASRADDWRDTLAGPLRRAWCRRYLAWLGRDRLDVMGYSLDDLLNQLDNDRPAGAGAVATR